MFSLLVMVYNGTKSCSHSFRSVNIATSGRAGGQSDPGCLRPLIGTGRLSLIGLCFPVFSWDSAWPVTSL